MATTSVMGTGPLLIGGTATVSFTPGVGQVDSDIVVEVDWDGDGDFDEAHEDITALMYEGETMVGRDFPSQLNGKAGPGQLRLRVTNADGRFSRFNTASPLNQGANTLDPGRKVRVRTTDTTDIDPVTLVRDRFDTGTAITTDELGTPWEHQATGATLVKSEGTAVLFAVAPATGTMVIDCGQADYFAQMTIAELGDNVDVDAGFQELNENRLIYRWQDSSNYSYLSYGPFDGVPQHAIHVVDVVAGTPSVIAGPVADVSGSGEPTEDYSAGDHRRRVTIGVAVSGSDLDVYVNGCLRLSGLTAIQTDETHVGLHVYYGLTNRAPAIDRFEVWDRPPTAVPGVIWTGRLTDVTPSSVAGGPREATITAEGNLAQLAGATINPSAWGGRSYPGVAIGDAIERAGMAWPSGELALGTARVGSSSDAEINALTHARKVEEVEFGWLHEAPEGWLVFRDRAYRDDLAVSATFTDNPNDQYGFQTFDLLPWRRELVNRVTAGVSYGPPNFVSIGGANSGNATGVNHPIELTFPTVEDGDLLVVMITSTVDSNSEQWLVPVFWVRERDTGASVSRRTQVYTHICAATESASTVRFYNDTANAGGSHILRFYHLRDWYGSHEGIHVGPWARGTSFAGADPEAILPPWGDTNPTAYIAQRAGTRLSGAGAVSANPTYPLGYIFGFSTFQGGTSSDDDDCGMQLTVKEAMSAVEDAGTFTGFTNLQNAETSVIAVRGRNGSPPEPRGRLRTTVDDTDSQRANGTVVTYDATDLFPTVIDAEAWAELVLSRYATLRPHVRISFTATASGGYRSQAAERRLGDKIHLTHTDEGINGDFHIESIRHRWSNSHKLWVCTWELSPAD